MKSVTFAILAFALVTTAAHAANTAARRPTLPPITRLADWRDRPFFDHTSKRVVTFQYRGRTADQGGAAIGVDLTKREVVFYIRLTAAEMPQFTAQLGKELNPITQPTPTDSLNWDILGQIAPPPPPPPDPIGKDRLAAALIQGATEVERTQSLALRQINAAAGGQR